MTEHLLIVSLGPVQDFIAAARRCQDLWFGSYLLSKLSLATAEGMQKHSAPGQVPELIFPGGLRNEKSGVANKIVALLPAGLSPQDVADTGRRAMKESLHQQRDVVFERCAKLYGPDFTRNLPTATAQVEDLIELQWVAVPISSGEGGYAQAHAQAEQLLAWRKNTRNFGPVPWTSAVGIPKSSIDGQRESVIDEAFFERPRTERYLVSNYQIELNERLCGVGLLKRFGKELLDEPGTEPSAQPKPLALHRPIFHSNSHVAAGPLLARFWQLEQKGEKPAEAFAVYVKKLRELGLGLERFRVRCEAGAERRVFPGGGQLTAGYGLDGSLLYEDRLKSMFEEDSTVPLEPKNALRDTVQKAREALGEFLKVLDVPRPSAYYVILSADGDRMGATITELAKRTDGKAQHQKLSETLAAFAARTREIIERDHAGSLIYSGGDDVLALLPLHTALRCASALRTAFDSAMAGICESPPTLSVGVAMVHHLEHMSVARERAREAEKIAKKKRNSLAVLVDKRSGGLLSVSRPWDHKNKKGLDSPLNKRIEQWCQLLQKEILPDGVAYELEALLEPFELEASLSQPMSQSAAPAAVIDALVRRSLSRKPGAQVDGTLHPQIDELLHTAAELAADPIGVVRGLSAEIQIAREFQRADQIAKGEAP